MDTTTGAPARPRPLGWTAEHERAAGEQARRMVADAALARDAAMRRANDLALAEQRRHRAMLTSRVTLALAEVDAAIRRDRGRLLARLADFPDPILAFRNMR